MPVVESHLGNPHLDICHQPQTALKKARQGYRSIYALTSSHVASTGVKQKSAGVLHLAPVDSTQGEVPTSTVLSPNMSW